ncbi:unnamed protein product [Gadus morhua 'NCC']
MDLQGVFVHLTIVTLRILNNTPWVAVDTCAALPLCTTRRPVLQLKSNVLRKFESAPQLLALKDSALLASCGSLPEDVCSHWRVRSRSPQNPRRRSGGGSGSLTSEDFSFVAGANQNKNEKL